MLSGKAHGAFRKALTQRKVVLKHCRAYRLDHLVQVRRPALRYYKDPLLT